MARTNNHYENEWLRGDNSIKIQVWIRVSVSFLKLPSIYEPSFIAILFTLYKSRTGNNCEKTELMLTKFKWQGMWVCFSIINAWYLQIYLNVHVLNVGWTISRWICSFHLFKMLTQNQVFKENLYFKNKFERDFYFLLKRMFEILMLYVMPL